MKLCWHYIHKGYYAAMPDGSEKIILGEDMYVVRTTPGLLATHDELCAYHVVDPDSYIRLSGCTLLEGKRFCEEDAERRFNGYEDALTFGPGMPD